MKLFLRKILIHLVDQEVAARKLPKTLKISIKNLVSTLLTIWKLTLLFANFIR